MTQLQEPTPPESEAKKAGFNNIAEIGRERIKKTVKIIEEEFAENISKRENALDVGFKTYRLTSSTFNVWDVTKDDNLQKKLIQAASLIRNGAKEEDILVELILKSGYGLTEKIEKFEVEGKKFYSVGDGVLIISLGGGLTLPVIRSIADRKPLLFIAREEGFSSDDVITNTSQIMKDNDVDFRVI
jgi:adenine-specific DNA-methyltransferase